MAYQGLAYRIVAEELKRDQESFITNKVPWDKLVFIGFNALNKAEEVLITELKKQQKCDVLFDADEYYMNDEKEVKGILNSAGLKIEDNSWPLKISGKND